MRLIDADALEILEYLEEFPTGQLDKEWNEAVRCVNSYVANTPTIDAVPVVRCKDCKNAGINNYTGKLFCKKPRGCYGIVPTKKDDFCSYGERRATSE